MLELYRLINPNDPRTFAKLAYEVSIHRSDFRSPRGEEAPTKNDARSCALRHHR